MRSWGRMTLVAGLTTSASCAGPASTVAPTVPAATPQTGAPRVLPKTVASGLHCPTHIAVDAAHVYWKDSDGAVARAPKHGGAAEILATAPPNALRPVDDGFALDDDAVYWAIRPRRADDIFQTDPAIMRRRKSAGPPTVIVRPEDGTTNHVRVDATHVYWQDPSASDETWTLRAPKTGGPTERVTPGLFRSLTVSQGWAYGATRKGDIARAPVAGGALNPVAQGEWSISQMAVDKTHVYWSTVRKPHVIFAAPKEGGTATKVADVDSFFEVMAEGAGHLYWIIALEDDEGLWTHSVVQRVEKHGSGKVETIADNLPQCMNLALDERAVYIACCGTKETDSHDGSIEVRALSGRS